MKLSKALRVKDQLITQINNIKSKIRQFNSYDVKSKPKWNVVELYTKMRGLQRKLIELKTKISLANQPVLEKIHLMEETKSLIRFLNSDISTKEGIKRPSYRDDPEIEYACFIDELGKAEIIETEQAVLEEIQDVLAAHNASVDIEFSESKGFWRYSQI
jgi:hypothetical protein